MDASREIYWNVGQGAAPLMYILAFSAIAVLVFGFYSRLRIWRRGKSLDRLDRPLFRLARLLGVNAGQTLVARTGPGIFHAFWFWSFAILFVGTLIVMAQADFTAPLFGFVILKGDFYRWYSLVLDLAGTVALAALISLQVRRFVARPKSLETRLEDALVHALLAAIILTGYFIEALRMAATEIVPNPSLAPWSPVGLALAGLFSATSPEALSTAHRLLWWLHFALVLAFIVVIPRSKLRHILTTAANAFFAPLEEKGHIETLDLEDEKTENFGLAKVKDLSWKDIFDADACTKCARCQDACPAWSTEKPLSPMKVVRQLGEAAEISGEATLCDLVGVDALWACTTCRACQEICPAGIEQVNKIIGMRRNLSLMEGAFPDDGTRKAFENIEVNGNPFGLAFASRGDWAAGLPLVDGTGGVDFDILYFAGCYASFDARNRKIARDFMEICAAAGIRVAILGAAEKCCGEPVRKLGNEYLYQSMASANIEAIKASGARRVVTTCPHCLNTLGRDYRDLGLDIPVEHHATFIDGLIRDRKISLNTEMFKCTYHDSCYIGRYKGVYEEPRRLIRAAGGSIAEMEARREASFCCGGGGGRILAEEKIGGRISGKRIAMAAKTGAAILVSNCPFCATMFEDGVKAEGVEGSLAVRDIAELVAGRLAKTDGERHGA